MNTFEYTDYKSCVNDWIKVQEKGGYGQLRKLSQFLDINSVVISQIFSGNRDLTCEQALGVTKFMGHSTLERDYFLLMVNYARSGTHELKVVYKKQMEDIRESAQALKNRVKHQKLSDEDRATFYSHWYYSAIRLGVSIPAYSNVSTIAEHLNLERALVAKVLDFLVQHKLVVEKNGKFDLGPQVTHVGHDSPFVSRHHNNWRVQALKTLENSESTDLFYSGPMTLSKEAADYIKNQIIELIERSTKKAAQSDSEVLRCLNIDWFQIKG